MLDGTASCWFDHLGGSAIAAERLFKHTHIHIHKLNELAEQLTLYKVDELNNKTEK